MATRMEELQSLVTQYLRAESEADPQKRDRGHDIYQWMLIEARVTADDIDWIDREIARRKVNRGNATSQSYAGQFRDLPVADIVNALRDITPMSRLYRIIRKVQNWSSDTREWTKAYIMACFSEIAYLHVTDHELAGRDRYKIFAPSLVLSYLLDHGHRIDLAAVMLRVADIKIEIVETRRFVYIIANVNSFVVIAVRGTASWRDWLLDMEALKNPAPVGFYHRGFHDEAERALPLLLARVGERRPLYITGHSLGGAVASLLSKIWPDPRPQTPYVFASPRFGTRAAAHSQPRYAHVRPADLVPHLPPRFLGYSDAGAQFETLPATEARRSGLGVLGGGVVNGFDFSAPHSMEGHRALLGSPLGEPFGEHPYISALAALAPERKRIRHTRG